MISVVICSVRPDRLEKVRESIAATIGVAHEFRVIHNQIERLGICAAYNKAAQGATGDILCFVHEDVAMLTPGWGQRVLRHFAADAELGLIGVAGSRYKSRTLSGWSQGNEELDCGNIHEGATLAAARRWMARPAAFAGATRVPVCVLDGVWLCVRRSVWAALRFDESIAGFHFYDIDFSLRCHRSYRVAVVYDVDLLHFSTGTFGHEWAHAALAFHQVAADWLPASCAIADQDQMLRWERGVQKSWLKRMRKRLHGLRLKWRWLQAMSAPADWRDAWRRLWFLLS
ncbi:MAG: glycosyltransferase [Comamonas sp.]